MRKIRTVFFSFSAPFAALGKLAVFRSADLEITQLYHSFIVNRNVQHLTLAVTPAISTTFWNTIYFYAASATAGNLSYDCARGRHCTVSAAASRRHVDAFLDLFTRESPRLERFIREESSQRAPPFFVDGGSIN